MNLTLHLSASPPRKNSKKGKLIEGVEYGLKYSLCIILVMNLATRKMIAAWIMEPTPLTPTICVWCKYSNLKLVKCQLR